MRGALLGLLTLLLLAVGAEGLGFDLLSSKVKCFSEEISGNTLVVGGTNLLSTFHRAKGPRLMRPLAARPFGTCST